VKRLVVASSAVTVQMTSFSLQSFLYD
jgi:hypothetical protein